MTETSRKKVLYVLLVASVVFGIYNFSQPRKRYMPESSPQEPVAKAAVVSAGITRPQIDIAAMRAEPWGGDPFRTSSERPQRVVRVLHNSTPDVYTPHWDLSGIVFNSRMPMAIINGQMVRVGDIVDEAKVIGIDPSKVTLLYSGSRFEIKVNKG